jgi:beta-lactamase class D
MFNCRLLFTLAFFLTSSLRAEENFLMLHGQTAEVVLQEGANLNQRYSPGSTFKIPLSLIGFETLILKNERSPIWNFEEGYDDYLPSWKFSQNPLSWMKNSCVWYSRILIAKIGLEPTLNYLNHFHYGNCDMSAGLDRAWLSSSLLISVREQAVFILKMLRKDFNISHKSIEFTKHLLFIKTLDNDWKLFGKTGLGSVVLENEVDQIGWFVGWIEKNRYYYPFAFNKIDSKVELNYRIERVKLLLEKSRVMDFN